MSALLSSGIAALAGLLAYRLGASDALAELQFRRAVRALGNLRDGSVTGHVVTPQEREVEAFARLIGKPWSLAPEGKRYVLGVIRL